MIFIEVESICYRYTKFQMVPPSCSDVKLLSVPGIICGVHFLTSALCPLGISSSPLVLAMTLPPPPPPPPPLGLALLPWLWLCPLPPWVLLCRLCSPSDCGDLETDCLKVGFVALSFGSSAS